jgi:hypothetical protein
MRVDTRRPQQQLIDSSAAFEFEVPKRIWPQYSGNCKFAALVHRLAT